MTESKTLTLLESSNYYHIRATLQDAEGDPVDYLFTTSQLEVARSRAKDKPHLLPPPPAPAAAPMPAEPPAVLPWWKRLLSKDKA